MKIFFSPTILGFRTLDMVEDGSYSDSYGDFVELSDSERLNYWKQSPPCGKTLGVATGRPAWVDLPPPTHEELVASAIAKKNQLKAAADSEIEWRQDAVDDGSASEKEIVDLAAWRKYRLALMRIDTSKALGVEWPESPQ
ncbi:tail fiber assembly protein [Yersinia enterocolitica]